MMASKKRKQSKKKNTKKDKAFKKQIFLVAGLLMGVIFLPTTFLLIVGLLPSLAAMIAAKANMKTKALTVGAMNLAGTTPFLLQLWTQGHNFERAFEIVTDPKAIIVMYAAAAVGYLIDWAMTGIIASILLQRGKARRKAVEKRQKELVERWGKEVKGDVPMDEYGFEIKEVDPA